MLPGILHGVEGDIVVDGEDSCGAWSLAEEVLHGQEGAFAGEVGGGDEAEIDLESFFDEHLHIGLGAFFGRAHFFGSVEYADAAVSFFDEEFDGFTGAAIHIGIDLVEFGKGRDAVEED